MGNVCEVGAGSGNISEIILKKELYILYCFEPARNIYTELENKFKNNNKVVTINDTLKSQKHKYEKYFDTLLYVNVLEHINDDKNEIEMCHEVLRPGGFLCIFVPALKILFSKLDIQLGHYRRYSKKSLLKLLNSTKFELIKIKYFDFIGIFPWFIYYKLLKKTIKSGNVNTYDKLIIPLERKIENIFPPFIGKNLILVVQKKHE